MRRLLAALAIGTFYGRRGKGECARQCVRLRQRDGLNKARALSLRPCWRIAGHWRAVHGRCGTAIPGVLLAQRVGRETNHFGNLQELPGQRTCLAPDHADGSRGLRVLEASDRHRRRACLHRHGHFRDQGDADAGADHLNECGQRARVQHLAWRRRLHIAERQRLIAKTVPLFQQKQPHFAQRLAAGHRRALILARPDQQKILRKQGDLGKRRFRHRQGNDCRVEPPFRELLYQLLRQRLTYVNVEFGMHSREVRDDRRQQIGCNRRDHADAQPARKPVPRRTREVSQFVDRAQDVADALDDLFSELRKPDLSRASLDQHAAQSLLQFLDLHRQGRLRDRTCFCRASEVAMTCQRIEIAKLPKGDIHQNILSQ